MDIQKLVKKLSEIKQRCENERRDPTNEERSEAERLITAIEAAEGFDFFTPKRRGRPVEAGNDFPVYENQRDSKKAYELRNSNDPKDYRSLYGSKKDEYRWTDKESTFFEALFSGRYHPDLTKRGMTEKSPSGGGYLVPVEFSETIHNISLENELVMPLATVQPMRSNSIKLPAFEIGNHSNNLFGGFTASYTAEAGTMTDANPTTRQMELVLKKLTGFLRMSNELVRDAVGGEAQIIETCGKGLAWYRDKFFLKGNGAGQPLGVLNSPSLIAINKETGQASDTIVYQNLTNMMARLHAASFKNAVWICHQTTIPQLLEITIPIGTGGSHVQVLNESNGKFSMLTRPVIFTEKTEPLGDEGDILLADLSQYVVGLQDEMRIEMSQHAYFTTDELACRLIERHDGQSLWDAALTLEDGSTTVSPFVTLQERT